MQSQSQRKCEGGVDTFLGSASIGMPYIPIYSYDCSGMTGGLYLGTHVTYYNGAPVAKTTANSITGFSMVTI